MSAQQDNGVDRELPLEVWHSGESFLAFHRLRSHWFAELPGTLAPADFVKLVSRLPGLRELPVENAVCVLVFVAGQAVGPERLEEQNVVGCAVYSLEFDGLRCAYFRRADASGLVPTAEGVGSSVLTSDEITMLHFGSFDQVPDDSGSYFFRRAVTEDEANLLREMTKLPARVQLDDAVCGDKRLNGGVVYLQKPPVPDSCGVPCTTGGGALFYCALEPLSGVRYCKLATETCSANELALALANQAAPGAIPGPARRLLAQLPALRALRDHMLRDSPVGRKYVGYYRLLSRHLRLEASMVKQLAGLMPHVYKAVDALMVGSGDVVVVGEAMAARVESVLESLAGTDSDDLRLALEDVRADLAVVRGLSKAELSAYLSYRGATRDGG